MWIALPFVLGTLLLQCRIVLVTLPMVVNLQQSILQLLIKITRGTVYLPEMWPFKILPWTAIKMLTTGLPILVTWPWMRHLQLTQMKTVMVIRVVAFVLMVHRLLRLVRRLISWITNVMVWRTMARSLWRMESSLLLRETMNHLPMEAAFITAELWLCLRML